MISIISTYFGPKFLSSSGALDCVYSLCYKAPTMLPTGDHPVAYRWLFILLYQWCTVTQISKYYVC